MGKKDSSKNNDFKYPGGAGESVGAELETFKQSDESKNENFKQSEKKTDGGQITLTFRHNRTFELRIGKKFHRFEGKQTFPFDKSILKHKDFQNAKKYFVIKEVKK